MRRDHGGTQAGIESGHTAQAPVWRQLLWSYAPLLLIVVGGGVGLWFARQHAASAPDFIADLPLSWLPVLVLAVVASMSVGFPGSLVSIALGVVFDLALGIPLALGAVFAAACVTCAWGRHVDAPPAWERRGEAAAESWIQRARAALGSSDWRLIALLRVAPVLPFALVNFALGRSGVPWSSYLAGTAVGIVPGTVVHVYLGSVGERIATGGEWHVLEVILLAGGILGLFVAGGVFTRRLRGRSTA